MSRELNTYRTYNAENIVTHVAPLRTEIQQLLTVSSLSLAPHADGL